MRVENANFKKIIKKLEEENKIQLPKELCDPKEENVSFHNLNLLINELNNCYEKGAFTAVALLSRKIIVNLCDALHSLYKTPENPNDLLSKRSPFDKLIDWLKSHYYITLKDHILLKKMVKGSNSINHEINVSKSKEEARKFFQTIKGIIESNFDTKNIDFDNKELLNNDIVESDEENI